LKRCSVEKLKRSERLNFFGNVTLFFTSSPLQPFAAFSINSQPSTINRLNG